MKLLYCQFCGDVVRLFPEKRSCHCGKSWGQYLEDKSTTVQTYPSLSLGIANPDFETALETFFANPSHFSPLLAMRSWINPVSESDVTFVRDESVVPNEQAVTDEESESQDEEEAAQEK